MEIPTGFGQINWVFTGTALPTGAEVTCGVTTSDFVGTPTEAAQELYDLWATNIIPVQISTVVLAECRVKYGPNDTGPTGVATGNAAGGIGSAGIQPATALLVSKTTSFGGRAGRGRLYMPGMSESDVQEDGGVDAAYLTAAQASFDALRTDMIAAGLEPRLLHSADSPLSTPDLIDAFVVNATVATQRRRLRR